MNVFALHYDPRQAARWHCDAHLVKMLLETAQLLCTANHATGSTAPYKPTHANHPCAVWARDSRANYLWLSELGLELCREYTESPDRMMTPFAQAMPDELRGHDSVGAYRRYYQTKRGGKLGTWRRNRPEWWV